MKKSQGCIVCTNPNVVVVAKYGEVMRCQCGQYYRWSSSEGLVPVKLEVKVR